MSAIEEQIHKAISDNMPGAVIEVNGGSGGHFNIAVVSKAFEGLNTLERHRLVLTSIKELMAGSQRAGACHRLA